MSKKSIEDKFSIEMDTYFNGIKISGKPNPEEYNELLELGQNLADKDFSKNSNKEAVLNKSIKNIQEYKFKENNSMEKLNKTKQISIAVALFTFICMSLMQTSFAQNFVEKIIKSISLRHITVMQTQPSEVKEYPIPNKLKGKIFDENGKELKVFSSEYNGKIYTSEGEEIVDISNDHIVTASEEEKMEKEYKLIIKDYNELNKYTCFNVILPSYLPKNYKFNRAEFYKDENGDVKNTKYIDLCFKNEKTGKEIYMQQRFADEETSFVETTDNKIEKVKINNIDAVISNNRSIDWEFKGVMYMISSKKSGIKKEELIKIAESIK